MKRRKLSPVWIAPKEINRLQRVIAADQARTAVQQQSETRYQYWLDQLADKAA